MYKLKNTIVRSIVAITIGIVLIKWPRLAPNMIIIIIGILFIIPGDCHINQLLDTQV